ncbi:DM13 domain-containing protein [Hassallia byssoidea VB512170]|uniref:DM13 domain-containing protein n=1 Tax=Hassallia byssoidea VB512170 TaxID=1304833 RepID=A0A846HCK6_9CYAN|nr:DM13 domain-containing protein [Hassalia byssoidea]NEU74783.1 DM13 domain-containing protein [Hassalia byssoidea VB512170]
MKFKFLAVLGIAAVLSVSYAKEATSKQVSTQMQHTTASTTVAQATQGTATDSGTFKAGEHPTQGTVSVVTDKGKRYLEFDQSFKTDNGPDLYVILHRSDAPPITGIKKKDYASIARLQKTSGAQRYALPDNVNLADFRSVAVWCRKFNATFGYAPLGK